MSTGMITQGLGTALLLTQGFAGSYHGSGGTSLGGAQILVADHSMSGTGGTAIGWAQRVVADHSLSGTGGTALGWAQRVVADHSLTGTAGSGQGGCAPCSEDFVLNADMYLTHGGAAAVPERSIQFGNLITQGLGSPRTVIQGLLTLEPKQYEEVAGLGVSLGGEASITATRPVAAGGGIQHGGGLSFASIIYHIYMNSGQGEPLDYLVPLASVGGLSWTSGPLNAPGDYRMGVRTFDPATGLEEQNVDAVVNVVLDALGRDVTRVPAAPMGPRALPLAGGGIRVEWAYACTDPSRQPLGFHVYLGTGSGPDYASPSATVPWSDQGQSRFRADLTNLTAETVYFLGVRAFNAVGEEANTVVLSIRADGTPPSQVDSLQAAATNQEA